MESSGSSFLPRIVSVFYAVFDPTLGPHIVYQVPEGLIASPGSGSHLPEGQSPSFPAFSPPKSSNPNSIPSTPISRKSSGSILSPGLHRMHSGNLSSPRNRATSSNRTIFNFDDVQKYIIPMRQLCGRLVTCTTKNYNIMGFPCELQADAEHRYPRNSFMFNLCFVFDRSADLSCYEPIVRKVSRVLTSCEAESCFLSDLRTQPAMHGILEQLFEDLNSYSETSISVDRFNSIELKIFPFYPNPPPVHNWMVPLALIKLVKRAEENWDITMSRIIHYIDGVNHVSRIALLADSDVELVRRAISHLMYYQVIMMIDIFQFSNMYTLQRDVQSLADASHVRSECALYVTKPGLPLPDWPKLLHLYARFKPGKTVQEWMDTYEVHELGIDVRRFTSFGVIKGFLRRVHRWPIFIPEEPKPQTHPFVAAPPPSPNTPPLLFDGRNHFVAGRGRVPDAQPTSTIHAEAIISPPRSRAGSMTRTPSQAELSLGLFRTREVASSPRTTMLSQGMRARAGSDAGKRQVSVGYLGPAVNTNAGGLYSAASGPLSPRPLRPRTAKSPPVHALRIRTKSVSHNQDVTDHSELVAMLDGEHHTDELATKFGVGWPTLEQWLIKIGKGDTGKVVMTYR